MAKILIVDDEKDIGNMVSQILEDEGHQALTAQNSDDAFAALHDHRPDLVILDIWIQGSKLDGIEILERLHKDSPLLPVVMMSGHGNIETAVKAIKQGAYDFVEKPFEVDRMLLTIGRALEAAQLRQENQALRGGQAPEKDLLGESPQIQQLRQTIGRVAPTKSRVLITGPAGSGKEVVARMIHQHSGQAAAPFLVVNCAIMTPDRLEYELFGTEPGSVEAGSTPHIGILEQADGGTLVLDEIADMPLTTQGKIVRVLQEQRFARLGGQKPVEVDLRILATTSRDLKTAIGAGKFREDLYYRLNVVPLRVPSLEERAVDIPLLAQYFLERLAPLSGSSLQDFSHDAMAILQNYSWPGNVRQLKNIVEWVVIMNPKDKMVVESAMLPADVYNQGKVVSLHAEDQKEIMGLPLREARELFEREYLLAQVNRFGGNISKTAQFIGMERSALHRKLKSLGVHNNQVSFGEDDSGFKYGS